MQIKTGGQTLTVRENLVDRVVRYLDPIKGQRRFQARAMAAIAGGYIGASRSRRALSQWTTWANDADTDTLNDLPTLRSRSRDLIRNAPLASGAINTVCTNAVGTGLKLQARIDRLILGMDEIEADAWEASTEREWSLFAESQECDAGRTLNFSDMQDLVFRSALESGDVFILMPHIERPGSPYGLRLQVMRLTGSATGTTRWTRRDLRAELKRTGTGHPWHSISSTSTRGVT